MHLRSSSSCWWSTKGLLLLRCRQQPAVPQRPSASSLQRLPAACLPACARRMWCWALRKGAVLCYLPIFYTLKPHAMAVA